MNKLKKNLQRLIRCHFVCTDHSDTVST